MGTKTLQIHILIGRMKTLVSVLHVRQAKNSSLSSSTKQSLHLVVECEEK